MSVKVMGAVWDLKIGRDEKFILLAYADHADHNGGSIYPAVSTIAEKTGYSERSVQSITRILEERGILIPDGQGPRGTNRWRIPMRGGEISAPAQKSDEERCNSEQEGVKSAAPEPSLTVPQPSMQVLSEKDLKECNAKVDAILENERKAKNSWFGREKMPEPIRELLDIYVSLTNDRPSKGDLMDWLGTGNDWLEKGIIAEDLRRAYEKSKEGTGFLVNRPGSLTRTAGMFAGERRKKTEPVIIQEKKQEAPVSFDPNKPFYEQFPREEK